MKTLLVLALLALALIAVQRGFLSFSAQSVTDYADTGPPMDIRRVLSGPMISEGVIFGPTGRVTTRFVARMEGSWTGNSGTLSEHFIYDNGTDQRRLWHLKVNDDGSFVATADDIIGAGRGEQAGAVAHLTYRIRLPESAGGHVLDVTDWLYLMDNGTVMNRSEMRKFGIRVAELIATMRPDTEARLSPAPVGTEAMEPAQ